MRILTTTACAMLLLVAPGRSSAQTTEAWLDYLVEGFTPLDGEAREVSADKTRFQAGLGYVFGPELRLELQYIHMRTLNTTADKYEASSNVVWLAIKHFL